MNPYDLHNRYFYSCDQRQLERLELAAARMGAALANSKDAEREAREAQKQAEARAADLEQQLAAVSASLTWVSNEEYRERTLIKTLLELVSRPADDDYTAKVLRCELIKFLGDLAMRARTEADNLRADAAAASLPKVSA